MFVNFLVREAYRITKDDTRKTLQYKDLGTRSFLLLRTQDAASYLFFLLSAATSVQENDILDFLLVRPLPSPCLRSA